MINNQIGEKIENNNISIPKLLQMEVQILSGSIFKIEWSNFYKKKKKIEYKPIKLNDLANISSSNSLFIIVQIC